MHIILLTLRADIIQNDGLNIMRCRTTSGVLIQVIDKCVTDAHSLLSEDIYVHLRYTDMSMPYMDSPIWIIKSWWFQRLTKHYIHIQLS